MRYFFAVLLVWCSIVSVESKNLETKVVQSQNKTFSVQIIEENVNDKIKDARVVICTDNCNLDSLYFKWNFKNVSLKDTAFNCVPEGLPYCVTVFSPSGDSLIIQSVIPASSMSEKINSTIAPIVESIEKVFFWDPFEFLGVYDPVIYDSEGNPVLYPNGDIKKQKIPFLVVWLVIGAVLFTIRTKFINIRGLKYSIDLLKGKGDKKGEDGEVSHFQALTTALSATVGLGNIAGVAVAVTAGGAGAVFWMIVAGFLGMSSKFVECTLGVKYRVIKNGVVSGGPMYYLKTGLAEMGWGKLGKVLAIIFAVLCIGGSFGGGNMFQANQAYAQLSYVFPQFQGGGFVFGLILALLVAVVIVGGIKKIAKVTDKIVPFMCGLYVLSALIVIGMNIGNIGVAFSKIFYGAFSPDALKGGIIGVMIQGFQRAAFSNEAGVGSSSIAHAAVKTDEPVKEGLVALLEPFIDTIVVCTLTALVLIFTGLDNGGPMGETGSKLTSMAFESVYVHANYILLVAIILFAFSTMISWSYYGLKAWEYLFGDGKWAEYSYKLIFLVFVVLGASTEMGAVIDFSDLMILGMAFPNVIGLYFLLPKVREDLRLFIQKQKK
jgi:AGCS family alanine or glycine:cation symporter